MQQVYHSNARTNVHIRAQIQKSKETNIALSMSLGVSVQTISKWRNRDFSTDASCRPHKIEYALSDTMKALAISIRKSTWLPIDEILDMLSSHQSGISRSSVYRCFVAEKINKVPLEKKDIAKKFKEYEPGYLHIDVTYLPGFNGIKYYLFVAIDRATRLMFYYVYEHKTAQNADDFMDKCLDFFPFNITHILTDNGLEFTNKLIKSKKGENCQTPSKMDIKCEANNIEHRLTKPATPKTNGMVERVNGTIKNNTILIHQYPNPELMKKDLALFLINYTLYRRHGSLKKELKVKTPFQALKKWYQLKPEIFIKNPDEFQVYLIHSQQIFINFLQQPCET